MDERVQDLKHLQSLLQEATQLGMKYELPSSWTAGLVLSSGWANKQLKKIRNSGIQAEFNARLATPEYATAKRVHLVQG